jgi:acetyl-CoA carboxylase biotin carboxylase subunit
MVSGLDLVQLQLRIAAGEPLPFAQEDVEWSGHAIECRITSEDPHHGFLPSTGRIDRLELPTGPGVRWDGGIAEGYEVSLFYDPLLGKLIVHAPDRASAIARMERALGELRVVGVETSAPFHRRVMRDEEFRAGNLDVRYLERRTDLLQAPAADDASIAAAVAAALLEDERRRRRGTGRLETARAAGRSGWRGEGWRG